MSLFEPEHTHERYEFVLPMGVDVREELKALPIPSPGYTVFTGVKGRSLCGMWRNLAST